MVDQLIDADRVRRETDSMINMITHPAFVDAMKKMKETPLNSRREVSKSTLTLEALAAQGVPIPSDMRITTRYFEPGNPEVIEIAPDGTVSGTVAPKFPSGKPNDPTTMAWGGCACGGTALGCAGAGGSTSEQLA
jgi:hypothetical protein